MQYYYRASIVSLIAFLSDHAIIAKELNLNILCFEPTATEKTLKEYLDTG